MQSNINSNSNYNNEMNDYFFQRCNHLIEESKEEFDFSDEIRNQYIPTDLQEDIDFNKTYLFPKILFNLKNIFKKNYAKIHPF